MTESVDRKTAVLRLRSADDILILCHKNPDGDTIGCAGALYLALKALGKNAAILCSDPIPSLYDYMELRQFDQSFTPAFVVAVDVASIQLFGDRNNVQKYAEHVQLCIDHHASNSGYAYETLLDPGAAAACEVMAGVISDMGVPIDASIADCLYTGIATDTGCFRFASTTARTHQVAAHLIEAGADVERLNARLFESRSRARLEIERIALESLEYFFDGRCAMIYLTWDQIVTSGVPGAELEDLTSLPRSIDGVEVGLTLRHRAASGRRRPFPRCGLRDQRQPGHCALCHPGRGAQGAGALGPAGAELNKRQRKANRYDQPAKRHFTGG